MVVEVRLELTDTYDNHLFEVLEIPIEQDNFLYLIEDAANSWFYNRTGELFNDIITAKGCDTDDYEALYEQYLNTVVFSTDID